MNITRSSWLGTGILLLVMGVAVATGFFLGVFRHRTEIGYTKALVSRIRQCKADNVKRVIIVDDIVGGS